MRINYRINPFGNISEYTVAQLEEEMPITGYFEMRFNNNKYGYYHDKPYQEGEEGLQSLSSWFNILLEAYSMIVTHDYVLVNDIQSFKMFLLFEKENDLVRVSLVECPEKLGIGYTTVDKNIPVKFGRWNGEVITLSSIKNEIIKKGYMFIDELIGYNSRFIQVPSIYEIKTRLNRLEEI